MSRIAKRFADLKAAGKKGFVAYISAGDPDLETSFDILKGLPGAGASRRLYAEVHQFNKLPRRVFCRPFADIRQTQSAAARSGEVSTEIPASVTASVCSKWTERAPSTVTSVQPFPTGRTRG